MSDPELLEKIDAAIEARLNGAAEEWQEGQHRFKGASLDSLYRLKEKVEARIAGASGPVFLPIVGTQD